MNKEIELQLYFLQYDSLKLAISVRFFNKKLLMRKELLKNLSWMKKGHDEIRKAII